MSKESQLDEIERLANTDDNDFLAASAFHYAVRRDLFCPGGEIYEMRRDLTRVEWELKSALDQLEKLQQAHDDCSQNLEVARQANSEISKHNQELSKENEHLKKELNALEEIREWDKE